MGPRVVVGESAAGDHTARRLRRARRIVLGTFVSVVALFPGIAAGAVVSEGPNGEVSPWRVALGVALSVPLAWLCLRMVRARLDTGPRGRSRSDLWLSCAVTLAVAICFDFSVVTVLLVALWLSIAALVAPYRVLAAVAPAWAVALSTRALSIPELSPGNLVFLLGVAVLWAGTMWLCNHLLILLWEIASEAYAARDAQAKLAVSEERLRFARDMHDLIGHNLSSIAVKSELAARLAESAPQRAAREMTAVRQVARDALREVRTAVSGYRDVDTAAEIESVRAVLTAAGVHCTVTGAEDELPPDQRTLAAWIIREGGTNVLRHSVAKRCAITLRRDENAVIVEIHNDGVGNGSGAPEYGNGLTGLRERVSAMGGSLSAHTTPDGGFLLRAVVPAPDRSWERLPPDTAPSQHEGGTEVPA